MNQRNSTIELSSSFQPEIKPRRVARKSLKKIRYRCNCFLIRLILMVKKYMHENLKQKHTVKEHFAKKNKKVFTLSDSYYQQQQTLQISYQIILTFSLSYSQTILHTFPDNNGIFRGLLVNNTTRFSSLYQEILTFSESSFQIKLQ